MIRSSERPSHLSDCPVPPTRRLRSVFAGVLLLTALAGGSLRAQGVYTPYYITTYAGTGVRGSTDGSATTARFGDRLGLAVDNAGNVFVADNDYHTIRKIAANGTVTTLAGTPNAFGTTDGTGVAARFNGPRALAVDASGNLFVADQFNHAIRRVTPAGVVTTFAGLAGTSGSADGTGTAARFNGPCGIAIDAAGNLYVGDSGNATVRRITPAGVVSTLAGSPGQNGAVDGAGGAARFNTVFGVAVDGNGNVYAADNGNSAIRKITPAGVVTTLAGQLGALGYVDATGGAARFGFPIAVAVDSLGNVFVCDSLESVIRKVTPAGVVTTIAGLVNTKGHTDGLGDQARFDSPTAIAVDRNGTLFINDDFSYKVRRSVAAPTITDQPMDASVVIDPISLTGAVIFGVTATSEFPMTYQWRKNGAPIAGATSGSLFLNNVQAADAGVYSVVVSSMAGSTTSNGARLTVTVFPVIVQQPQSRTVTAGTPASFSVLALPATAKYQWRRNGTALAGATTATLTIASAALTDAGDYTVVVSNDGVDLPSSPATLTVNVPVNTQAVTQTVYAGSPVQMGFTGAPAAGTTFQWRKNGQPIAGATSSVLSIASVAPADAGDYTLLITSGGTTQTSNTATLVVLAVNPPTITTQPSNRSATVGTSVQFMVAATSPVPMTYQWRKNGAPITGATSSTLNLPNVTLGDAGTYSVVVTNAGGPAISANATLAVADPIGTAPAFTTQPAEQTINAGGRLTLSAAVSGTAPFTIQWYHDGVPIPGATALTFTVASTQPADAGPYFVVVSNAAGLATSRSATVRVNVPPTLGAVASTKTATAGSVVEFSITASGTTPLAYQWRKDGVAVPGATNATLSFASVQSADAGSYDVVVTNAAGAATSGATALTVTPAGPSSRLSNVSIRTTLGAGQTVVVGIVVQGGSRDVLVRAVGPTLATFGVTGAMTDPRIELYRGQTLVVANDDWPASLAPAIAGAGAFALASGSRDAAVRQSVDGTLSVQARGTGAGVVLVEAYDLGDTNVPRIVNVSARNRVGTGDDVLIAGFNVVGTGTKQLLVRAVGPGLAALGVSGTLVDPRLEIFNAAGVRVAENDNWSATLAPTFSSVGAFALPGGSRDAALVTSLAPGAYTVQARGADGGTGEAVVEVYELP